MAGRTRRSSATAHAPRRPSAAPRRGGASPGSDAGAAAQLQLQGAFTPGGAQPSEVVEGEEAAVPATPAAHRESGNGSGDVRVLAKPPVRKLAKDLGIDLRDLTPTGS